MENHLKICAVICEYNPFHNGHRYQLEQIRNVSGCDLVLCLMSGNFTQRGEGAILDKYTRATLAVQSGADIVMELPLPFSIGNAEIFARGAVKMLAALPSVTTLAFGAECGTEEEFFALAHAMNEEDDAFRQALQRELHAGISFAAARQKAVAECFPSVDQRLYTSPNCVLGLEYAKAILRAGAKISLLPLPRKGACHGESALRENYSSASAIRAAFVRGGADENLSGNLGGNLSANLSANLPECTRKVLPLFLREEGYRKLDDMEYFALADRSLAEIARLPDCSEGLEHGLKAALQTCFSAEEVIKEITSKRYTSARIRRILLSNVLGVTAEIQRACIGSALYFRPLAVSAEKSGMVLSLLQKEGGMPVLSRKGDEVGLQGVARELLSLTMNADLIYASLCHRPARPFYTAFVVEWLDTLDG
jgi:predicted nucleotidyltransferase